MTGTAIAVLIALAMSKEDAKYYPQLDGIRWFAVLAVMLAHFLPGGAFLSHFGHYGVVIFFVLSGYLITGLLLRYRISMTRQKAFLVFYARRTLRIFPIYYLTIAGAALVGFPQVRDYFLWHLTYTSNLKHLSGVNFGASGHLWSLCVEEQFYLIWPFLVLYAPFSALPSLGIGIVLLSLIYKSTASLFFFSWTATNFLLPGCLDALGLGAVVAISQARGELDKVTQYLRTGLCIGLGVAGIVWLEWLRFSHGFVEGPEYHTLINLALAVSFLPLLVSAIKNQAPEFLQWHPFRYLGKISYGIYLYHFFLIPILDPRLNLAPGVGRTVVYIGASVLVAALSWHYIERPINRLKGAVK